MFCPWSIVMRLYTSCSIVNKLTKNYWMIIVMTMKVIKTAATTLTADVCSLATTTVKLKSTTHADWCIQIKITLMTKKRFCRRFLSLRHASGTVCHYTSLEHHLCRLSGEEAVAVFVQPQFSVLISCSLELRLRSRPIAAFGRMPHLLTN